MAKKFKVKDIKDKIKKYEELAPKLECFLKDEYIDKDNNAVIYIKIEENYELYNKLSYGKQIVLNDEIISYIDKKAYNIPVEYPLKLCIIGNIDDADKNNIKDLIHENYYLILKDKRQDLKINFMKSLALFIFGVIVLAGSFALQATEMRDMFVEILSIIGTFSLWEAVDFYLLERKGIKLEYIYAAQLALSKIEFKDELQ